MAQHEEPAPPRNDETTPLKCSHRAISPSKLPATEQFSTARAALDRALDYTAQELSVPVAEVKLTVARSTHSELAKLLLLVKRNELPPKDAPWVLSIDVSSKASVYYAALFVRGDRVMLLPRLGKLERRADGEDGYANPAVHCTYGDFLNCSIDFTVHEHEKRSICSSSNGAPCSAPSPECVCEARGVETTRGRASFHWQGKDLSFLGGFEVLNHVSETLPPGLAPAPLPKRFSSRQSFLKEGEIISIFCDTSLVLRLDPSATRP